VEVFGNGNLDISFSVRGSGVTFGSIEGNGIVFLGAENLTVGGNKLSTTFSGVIQDGGLNNVTGGSLNKIGKGKLTLTNANSYNGGTVINNEKLIVSITSGSATGAGAVQVNAGMLRGDGIIAGAVTVGKGSGHGVVLSPGNRAVSSAL
jgi:fibronectin-binding autotransporter adhesin